MNANTAFGFIAMVAHNLLRWASIHENPSRPKFSKKFRREFINIPGKMVSHGRTLTLKIAEHFLKEVEGLRTALRWEPESALVPLSPNLSG
jgi:hypothetical protein